MNEQTLPHQARVHHIDLQNISPEDQAKIAELRQERKESITFDHLRNLDEKDILNLDYRRVEQFLGVTMDKDNVFLLPASLKPAVKNMFPGGKIGQAFFSSFDGVVVVFFSREETKVSIESRLVHEFFHQHGLVNTVTYRDKSNPSTVSVETRRLGFKLYNADQQRVSGEFLEEITASYAGWAYLRKYGGYFYQAQVQKHLRSADVVPLTQQLNPAYILLDTELRAMPVDSLFAFLGDHLRGKLGMRVSRTDHQAAVRELLAYRADPDSIRRFISLVDEKLGKGSYALLRDVMYSESTEQLQMAADLLTGKSTPNKK